jgi:phosphatidylserine/phosphatidylglycerophosphate/cardiolipin synthase-like enzyme
VGKPARHCLIVVDNQLACLGIPLDGAPFYPENGADAAVVKAPRCTFAGPSRGHWWIAVQGPLVRTLQKNVFLDCPTPVARSMVAPTTQTLQAPAPATGCERMLVVGGFHAGLPVDRAARQASRSTERDAEQALLQAIRHARSSIRVEFAEALLNPRLEIALGEAVARGVPVRLLTSAGMPASTMAAWRACERHAGYASLLARGVRIYEGRTLNAPDTVLVDGVWVGLGLLAACASHGAPSAAGAGLVVLNARTAHALEQRLERDRLAAAEITGHRWLQRSRLKRLLQWLARKLR